MVQTETKCRSFSRPIIESLPNLLELSHAPFFPPKVGPTTYFIENLVEILARGKKIPELILNNAICGKGLVKLGPLNMFFC